MSAVPPGLELLFTALRGEGLVVGVREVARVRAALLAWPDLDLGDLRGVLRALLVADPDQRERFDRAWRLWEEAVHRQPLEAPPPTPAPSPVPVNAPLVRPGFVLALLLAWALLWVDVLYRAEPPPPPPPVEAAEPEEPPPEVPEPPADTERATTWTAWVPRIEVVPVPFPWTATLAAATTLIALALGVDLWRHARRPHGYHLEPASGRLEGRARLPLRLDAPPVRRVEPAAARALVWGVGRFVAEDHTDALDTEATVQATARDGGLLNPRYTRDRHLRAVWLWGDVAGPARIAEEIAELRNLLTRARIECRVGSFHSSPERVRWEEGEEIRPGAEEGWRQTALVAVFTDGVGLRRRLHDAGQRTATVQLLHGLAAWPHVVFGDHGDGTLAAVLRPFGLRVERPEAVPRVLGGAPPGPARARGWDAGLWAGALALAGEPVGEAPARRLAAALGLRVDERDWAAISARGVFRGGGPARVAELARADRARTDGAVRFWLAARETEGARREAEGALHPWFGTPAHAGWRLEVALLRLWHAPREAVAELATLWSGVPGMAERVRPRLQALTPLVGALRDRWSDGLDPRTAWWLLTMGFPGRLVEGPRRRGRTWVGLGALGTVAASAALVTLGEGIRWAAGDRGLDLGEAPPTAWAGVPARWATGPDALIQRQGTVLLAGTDRTWTEAQAEAGRVTWTREDRACVQRAEGGWWLWCGRTGGPSVLRGDPRRPPQVVGWVAGADDGAGELARALLDGGTVDYAWVSASPPGGLATPINALHVAFGPPEMERWGDVRVKLLNLASFAAWLDDEGVLAFPTDWADVAVEGDRAGELRLGGSRSLTTLTHPTTGMSLVRLPGGRFRMGSEGGDSDERPVHEVDLSPFAIGKYEVSVAEYRRLVPDHPGEATHPVAGVSWAEADRYCRWLGETDPAGAWRLPTEAEWEYAARGGTSARWSWGDAEEGAAAHAWYSGNAARVAHPVGTRAPNPWGLHDLHGNVWEWVGDWYGEYPSTLVDNPTGPVDGTHRVVRGGSFVFDPVNLRSAHRFKFDPVESLRFFGFRCVRGPRHHP